MINFVISSQFDDALAPTGAKIFAGTMTTKFGSYIQDWYFRGSVSFNATQSNDAHICELVNGFSNCQKVASW